MTSGIVAIHFSSKATEDEIAMLVRKMYSDNMAYISGMQYREFKDAEPVEETMAFIDEMEGKKWK